MHRLLSDCASGEQCDHINGNGLDNRLSNLRKCTHRQNSYNKKKQANGITSKYIGVFFDKNRKTWGAAVQCGSNRWRKRFDSEIMAAKARDVIALKFFGEFASLNFPNASGLDSFRKEHPAIMKRIQGLCGIL